MKQLILGAFILLFSSSAFAQYIGRNKVQYTEFNWKVLKTEHFDIYYYPEMEELAQTGAAYAETAYQDLKDKFLHNLNNRVPLIFYSSHFHFEQTNTTEGLIPDGVGGFFEFLKGRVVIPSDGNLFKFRHVIRHELVHVFEHSKYSRVLKDYRVPTNKFFPLWFTEGLAEYWAGDLDDAQSQMVMRDATIAGYLVPLTEMNKIYGSYLMYKEGESICRYIGETYGDNTILQLFENMRKTQNFEEVFKMTLGKDYREFEKDWMYSLRKKYYPLFQTEDIPSQKSEVMTPKGFNFKPTLVFNKITQKEEVYYIGNYTGYTSIYKVPLEKTDEDKYPNQETVIEGERSDEFESFKAFDSGLSINSQNELAFITKSGENDVLHVYDLQKEELISTFGFREVVKIGNADWAKTSGKIAFSALDKSGHSDLYIFDTGSDNLLRMTRDRYDDRNPVWSPDDKYLIFSSDRIANGEKGKSGLFALDIKTGQISNLTNGNYEELPSSFSADGKLLLFTSTLSGSRNVWYLKWEDIQKNITNNGLSPLVAGQMTGFTTAAFDPSLRDGKLLFSAFENFSFKVRIIENATDLVENPISKKQVNEKIWVVADQWDPKKIEGRPAQNEFDYSKDYSLDIAQGQISSDAIFGTLGGVSVAFSDVLGDDRYFVTLYNNAETQSEIISSFNFAVSRVIRGNRTNYGYGAFRLSGRRYDIGDPFIYFYEKLYGGFFALSYPISSFNRIDASVTLASSTKESAGDLISGYRPSGFDFNREYGAELQKSTLVSNSISFVHDNSLWAFTGPLDGERYSLTLSYTTDIENNKANFYTIAADYRKYLRITDRSTYAFRVQTKVSEGDLARRSVLIGSWDIRGYSNKIYEALRGKKVWIMNNEVRFPLLDNFGLRFPFFDFNLSQFRGALFVDAGNAWDDFYPGTVGSYGWGVRYNFGGAIVLRYDVGKKWNNNLNNSSSYFYQFFFGWDF